MLVRALKVTNEQRPGTRYSLFFPASNGEKKVWQAVGNVIGSLSHLHLDGHSAEKSLTIENRNLPDEGYAQTLFEHGLIPSVQMEHARRVLDEDVPGRMVTIFVPEELEQVRRIVYNTLIVSSQSVHGAVRIVGQKVPGDAAAAQLHRAGILLPEAQYKRMLADFSDALAEELEAEMASLEEGSAAHLAHEALVKSVRHRADLALDQALQADKVEELRLPAMTSVAS